MGAVNIRHWQDAFAANGPLCTPDLTGNVDCLDTLSATARRQALDLVGFLAKDLIGGQGRYGHSEEWLSQSQTLPGPLACYTPRWTFPFTFFSSPLWQRLARTRVLDAGSRVGRTPVRREEFHRSLVASDEVGEAHFAYYARVGAMVDAIDVLGGDPPIMEMDVRALRLASQCYDLVTMPMILGVGNPLSGCVDIAMALLELRRVLKGSGIVYIADPVVKVDVVYLASAIGFRVFANGVCGRPAPVGLFLLADVGSFKRQSPLRDLLREPSLVDLTLRGRYVGIANRNLLQIGIPPPTRLTRSRTN